MTDVRHAAFIAMAAVLLLPLQAARADDAKKAELRALDALGRPGRAVKLRAKLERTGLLGINPDVASEPLDFFLLGQDGKPLEPAKFLGSGDTNKDGDAELDWEPTGTGQFELEVRLRRGSKYMAVPASCVVAVPPPDRTIVLVHVDKTVSQATNITMFRGTTNDQIAVVEGAPLILKALATHYQLVYLTDLDVSFSSKFKDWMRLRSVPAAPTVFWELFEKSLSHASYMEQSVQKLRRDHPQMTVGVGTETSDATAFIGAGMAGVLLQREPASGLAKEVLVARRWEEVLGHVALLHRSAALLRELAGKDRAKAEAALGELTLLGAPGLGYVHRFRQDQDPNLAAAATGIAARIEASDAFFRTLDLSTANRALSGLLAAWKAGDRAVVVRLHAERKAGLKDSIPTFRACEMVSRNEPEPGRVVYKLRLVPDEGSPAEREVAFVRGDDGLWRVDVKDSF